MTTLSKSYCITCNKFVNMVVPASDALFAEAYHILVVKHTLDVCTGPFASSPPPETDWAFVFLTEPSPDELAEQEVPSTPEDSIA